MATVDTALEQAALVDAIEASADAHTARTVLARVLDANPGLADELGEPGPNVVRDGLVAVAVASRSLSNAVVRDASLLDPLRDPSFAAEQTPDRYRAHATGAVTDATDPAAALRRWKQRELLRIAARDLLGAADLPTVGRELAALADACLAGALEVAAPSAPVAIVGMGKLGGRELNYASDVDVMFVHTVDGNEAEHAARAVLQVMAAPTADGIVFRTDADLRPEGRAGPLTRSLDSYLSYYERWAATWEFQALLKARAVAGPADLGERFISETRRFVWPDALDPDAMREIREMKSRAESETRRRGLADRELKRGRGGIRDVEFSVQLLQLVHGRRDESVRSPTTLDALQALATGGYIEEQDAARLTRAYTFLRTVEHRLQLYDEQQTHTLPLDDGARTRLARVLGYRDSGGTTSRERFEADHRAHQGSVRAIHERLFFAPVLDTLAGAGPLPPEAVEARLAAFGFADAEQTRRALGELTRGLTRRSRVMQELLPVVLGWLSESPDPDLGLLQLRRLAEGPTRSTWLARTLRDAPGAAERAMRVLGSSRMVGDALLRQPDFIESLGDDAALGERTAAELVEQARETLQWRTGVEARRSGLRRFKRREHLRIAARDLLGLATLDETERELTALADACVTAALDSAAPDVPFAVIGMGRYGGRELSYASDLDVLFVYDGDTPSAFDTAERAATEMLREIGSTTTEGQTFVVDPDLRPEGKKGVLARSIGGYREYYERWALTWEFQSLLKARPVAGDADVVSQFFDLAMPKVYRDEFPDAEAREVRRMKARIERERIPTGEDPQFHLKLGPGSLSDVEFTVQLLQLRHGNAHPQLRTPSTMDVLHELQAAGHLDTTDAGALEESYRFCSRARNARFLLSGAPANSLPTASPEAARLGRLLGYVHQPQTSLRDDYRRLTRRARRVVERLFYGREGRAEVSR
ncbi:MAG: bifunctional [glutamine synthetase] adenylyltransferase/[glutamine synthetase]-adenylyl-L-tyrosine phosphorylase [Acidimicrobiia bacterium]